MAVITNDDPESPMRHRSRYRGEVLALLLTAAATACQDSSPSLPTEAPVSMVSAPGTCDPTDIRALIDDLYPQGAPRTEARARFDDADAKSQAGQVEPARLGYVVLAADVIGRRWQGQLLTPPVISPDAEARDLIVRLYTCASLTAPTETRLAALRPPGTIGSLLDLVVGAAIPGQPFLVVTPSRNFSVSGDGDFFVEPALIVAFRIPDGSDLSGGQYDEYAPYYRVRVDPYSAHESVWGKFLPSTDPSDGGPLATVSMCMGDPHPTPLSDARVLLGTAELPGSPTVVLPVDEPSGVMCNQLPPYLAASASIRRSREGRLAALWQRTVQLAGGVLLSAFSPAPLYAVDGGIGGGTRVLASFVGASPQ